MSSNFSTHLSQKISNCCAAGVLLSLIAFSGNLYAQSFNWQNARPEQEGFSAEKLQILQQTLAKHNTTSILVIRNDRIVLEWYAQGWDEHKPHGTASLAKALVGGMSLAVALSDGKMVPEDSACKFIPQWRKDPLKSKITIRHLATHTSGIEDAELSQRDIEEAKAQNRVASEQHMELPGWKGRFWRKEPDPFTISRDMAPVLFPPGSANEYSNPGMAMLSYAIASSYRGTPYSDIRTLLRDRVYRPIGLNDKEWQIGYGQSYPVDGLNLVANWGGASFTPRDVARIGRLMLRKGNWEGKQLIDSTWAKKVTEYAGMPLAHNEEKDFHVPSTLAWYANYNGIWARAPRDLFLGQGAGNQVLIVIPSLNLIIVRNGTDMYDPKKGEGTNYGVVNYLINPLMDALVEPPYPMSNRIKGVHFAPASSIVRQACDSDNWPITWGDDDAQYTAYGDGTGFEPKPEQKLSLGLARIEGGPEDFKGINIRSGSGEQLGNGRQGKKASGILMVKGVLYLWTRNANRAGEESQLAWSSDHGKSWKWCDWKFSEGFGCPTFLNFGKNYRGAKDQYVYIYSHDEKDAYKAADRMVLARVKRDQLLNRKAYAFFVKVDDQGKPVWSKELMARGTVFSHPAMCYRSGISYNAGLKRFLWCQVHPESKDPQGSRFQGGFGIYEAATPWGPWHTVYYVKDWDVGPGETASFPTKWMSKDGKTCWLLFSGNDCFSVRKVEFSVQ